MSTSGIEHACMASRVCDGERESELGAIGVCRAETPAAICTVDLTTFGVVASERASDAPCSVANNSVIAAAVRLMTVIR